MFISHDLNVVGNIADRIVVLYRGKIMEKGNTADIIKNPKHPYTKILLIVSHLIIHHTERILKRYLR